MHLPLTLPRLALAGLTHPVRALPVFTLAVFTLGAAVAHAAPPMPLLPGPVPRCPEMTHGRGDLDADGRDDCFSACGDGGSGFGGVTLTIRPSCGSREATLDASSSFGDLVSNLVVPALLDTPAMREGAARLLGYATQPPDGSFRWLIAALGQRAVADPPFEAVFTYAPVWLAGPPTLPAAQAFQPPDMPGTLLVYAAHNHARDVAAPQRVAECGAGRSAWRTSHGVAVYDAARNAHSWVWLTTDAIKLRWPSVEGVECASGLVHVVLHRLEGVVREALIDPALGRVGVAHEPIGMSPALGAQLASVRQWARSLDLDGDGRADPIEVAFSGGAHCCYTLTLRSSLTGKRHALPFELDGGYLGGLDLSLPEQFDVVDTDANGLPELLMRVADGPAAPMRWRRRFGVTSSRVRVSLVRGVLSVRDR